MSWWRLGIEQDDELCKTVVNQMKCDLINSGFVPKVEKITMEILPNGWFG